MSAKIVSQGEPSLRYNIIHQVIQKFIDATCYFLKLKVFHFDDKAFSPMFKSEAFTANHLPPPLKSRHVALPAVVALRYWILVRNSCRMFDLMISRFSRCSIQQCYVCWKHMHFKTYIKVLFTSGTINSIQCIFLPLILTPTLAQSKTIKFLFLLNFFHH